MGNWFGLTKELNPFSKLNIKGPKGLAAGSAIALGIGAVGKLANKGVSNNVGNILDTAGNAAMLIPGYGWVAGAVLKTAGLVANGFTDRVNTQYQTAKNNEISNIGNWTSLANDYKGLLNEMSNFTNVDLGSLNDWGDIGFLSSGSSVKAARNRGIGALTAATGMRQQGVNARGQWINMNNTNSQLGHLIALGGPLDGVDPSTPIGYSLYNSQLAEKKDNNYSSIFAGTPSIFDMGGGIHSNGADFDSGVSYINTGGTHEENPYEGVQMGVDNQGIPNLVEEGEVKWNDYIFSNRLTVPDYKKEYKKKSKDIPYEALTQWEYSGKTFADAAKRILKKNGEGNDAITNRGNEALLSILAQVQEKEREKLRLLEIQDAIDNMSPEEFAMLQLQMESLQVAQALLEEALRQQLMIPQGMEQMTAQQQPIAALGGLLASSGNRFDYGGSFNDFVEEIKDKGLSIEDYLKYLVYTDKISLEQMDSYLAEDGADLLPLDFDKKLAEGYLDRINTISKLYTRRAKRQGINTEDLKGTAKNLYDKELIQAIHRGLENKDYDVNKDALLSFNTSKITDSKNRQQSYNNIANYDDLIARGGRAVALDEQGRPTWDSVNGLNRIDNSAEGFYNNLGELNDEALESRGIYGFTKKLNSSISDYDTLGLRGWRLGEDGNYVVSDTYDSPNAESEEEGNTSSTYKIGNLGDLKYKDEGYEEALKNIQENEEYIKLTKQVLDAINNANGDFSKLSPEILNYLRYLDAHTGNKEEKLLATKGTGEDTKTVFNPKVKDVAKLYDHRRNDNKYGIYHYLFDNGTDASASRYFYKDLKDGDKKIYIAKPEEDFAIKDSPEVITGDDGTIFNDYEVTGLNKNRTLTLLPTGEVIDVTDLADLPNWNKLDKPVLMDNTDNLGYGIKGNTDWVDYTTSPTGKELASEENPFPKPSNLPYLLGAGIQLGNLGYNILNPIDYSNADALISASKEAGTYTPIAPLFAGQRLPYKPTPDTKFGKIIGVGLGNARSIVNNSRGNIGATLAGLLLNALNTQLALGEADEAWRQGNWNMLKDVQTFGLLRDTSNYDRDLKAKMSNQDAESRARGYSLEGQRAAYAMRQALEDNKANAINAGLSGLANLAYNYSTNKDLINLLRWLGLSGAMGPMDMRNYLQKAEGGKTSRRKKGLSF